MEEIKLTGESKDIVAENISQLKELFPEIVVDDKIDFDSLKKILGESVDDTKEKYSFTWPGKSQAIKESQKQSTGTLRPCKDESEHWDKTQNIYIEGDNLEVLKLLQKGYYNKIKAIYIDPPYNTGNDFIYTDDYKDNLDNYLKISGQILDSDDKERGNIGIRLSTNTESMGRYHSNWLNMMYPRLRLARNLLTEDGIIFVSIDDNEVENLRKLMDELFGEENFMAQIIVEGTPKNDPHIISTAHEYCLVYVKNFNEAKMSNYGLKNPLYSEINTIFENGGNNFKLIEKNLKEFYDKKGLKKDNISNYKFADKLGVFRLGPIDDPQNSGPKDERINPITNTPCIVPNRGWSCSIETWNEWINNNLIYFPENNEKIPAKKTYIQSDRLDVMKAYVKIQTRKDTDALKKLFGLKMTPFPNPKPVELLKMFIDNCNDKNMIICDFFSGSASTAEATIRLNAEDNGNRKFLLIQIPEEITEENKSGKSKKIAHESIKFLKENNKELNICEIGKERIRRIGKNIIKESENKSLDIGFKVFKLDSSNLEKWEPDFNNIQQSLIVDEIKKDRTNEDLVYEIMLKYGVDLTLPIEKHDNIYSIGFGALVMCLEDNITTEVTDKILNIVKDSSITRVVFKDSGFASDADKTNIKEILKTNHIDEFITI
ncbi:site-specific DNA-methyltransferase [Methanobrevibacter thaueri]|uniref:Putative methyltransferase n=1 Tax=Methanobrevibacter thaueri TaxID=190975 RepID=A0A315XKR4_9EURY|nr:site-specific DNA-methyltransferase [Methanobrevibacter thaueri]PWB85242.1 putative methyltransferase [Methanobrevibacter thaueri]